MSPRRATAARGRGAGLRDPGPGLRPREPPVVAGVTCRDGQFEEQPQEGELEEQQQEEKREEEQQEGKM